MEERDDLIQLSKYVDGELSLDEALQVEEQLTYDEQTRDAVLKMLTTRSLLQACSAKVAAEKVPKEMYQAVYQSGRGWLASFGDLKKIAAVLIASISLVAVYFSGEFRGIHKQKLRENLVPGVAAEYRHVIDRTLENNGVGSSQSWNDSAHRLVTVTPVQTYRGKDKTFYRLYRLQITEGNQSTSLLCLAYRAGKEKWQNRAVIYESDVKRI